MFGLTRGTAPAPVTLAEAHAVGELSQPGTVAADSPVRTYPDAGGRVEDLGHRPLTSVDPGDSLGTFPGVTTRASRGGIRVSRAPGLLVDAPGFEGGHLELKNRRTVVVLPASERMAPERGVTIPSLRVPPVNDPYNRACNNAAAIAAHKAAGL